jgi:predicted 3-demethylubiquinone-9 3-methyltransferase (glyoxalase superfamily)
MQPITTCLWYNDEAEEAVDFYCSIFDNARKIATAYYPKASEEISGKKEGDVMSVTFELRGQSFMALNGGPLFSFTPAISFIIYCKTQEEIDRYWNALSAKPEAEACGWIQDKYGVSWQIVPHMLDELMITGEKEKIERMTAAMLTMKKLDMKVLKDAYDGIA